MARSRRQAKTLNFTAQPCRDAITPSFPRTVLRRNVSGIMEASRKEDAVAIDPCDILVTVLHPWAEAEMPLDMWMQTGPPKARPGVGPVRARRAGTSEPLPLRVIPLRYRNTSWSRLLIWVGVLSDPWKWPGDKAYE